MKREATISCPHCDRIVVSRQPCKGCGLDAEVLFSIRRRAHELANRGAHQAAAGDWKGAYDLAAASLGLMATENDLASFVLLVAALAGSTGPVRTVPRPRAEALPPSLGEHLDPLLSAIEELRRLGEVGSRVEILRLRRSYPWFFASREEEPEISPRRITASLRLLALAMTAALLIVVSSRLGFALGRSIQPSSAPESAQRAKEEQERIRQRQRMIDRLQGAVFGERWLTALQVLSELSPDTPVNDKLRVKIWSRGGQTAYSRGKKASSEERYQAATDLLKTASDKTRGCPPEDCYWRDDALYYLARSYQRLGKRDLAIETFRSFLEEHTGEDYVSDAQRQLESLEAQEQL